MTVLDSLRPPAGLRVLVTAGASGIGAAVARAFCEAGAHVHVCDIDRTALDRLATETPAITGSLADACRTVRYSMPRSAQASTVFTSVSTPALWPKKRGMKRFLAQRPLPSITMATWRGIGSDGSTEFCNGESGGRGVLRPP